MGEVQAIYWHFGKAGIGQQNVIETCSFFLTICNKFICNQKREGFVEFYIYLMNY